jgi:hypothetical protein
MKVGIMVKHTNQSVFNRHYPKEMTHVPEPRN